MCNDCGCGDPERVSLELQQEILSDNARTAAHNRTHFEQANVCTINLMGSPGSGKTAILEATAKSIASKYRLAAVSGDLATDNDARRLTQAGIRADAITTGSACHLDAKMVHHALHTHPLSGEDFFFIENVGNLVCPAVYDLGQTVNVVAVSVTEGEDKPLKYPVMFHKADLVLLTKTDLLPHLPNMDVTAFQDALSRVMPKPLLFQVSAVTGEGMERWVHWLESRAVGSVQAVA